MMVLVVMMVAGFVAYVAAAGQTGDYTPAFRPGVIEY